MSIIIEPASQWDAVPSDLAYRTLSGILAEMKKLYPDAAFRLRPQATEPHDALNGKQLTLTMKLDGVDYDLTDWLELKERRTGYSRARSGEYGLTVRNTSYNRKAFPPRKDGTFNFATVAELLHDNVRSKINAEKRRMTIKASQDDITDLQSFIDANANTFSNWRVSKPYIRATGSEGTPINVSATVNINTSPKKARRILEALLKLAEITLEEEA